MGTIEWIESGYDYLSGSLPLDANGAELWAFKCRKVVETIARDGHEIRERSMNGYDGISAGNCFVGVRSDGYFINLTGGYADQYIEQVDRPDLHYSRVDIQTTVKFHVKQDDIAQKAYANASYHNNGLPSARQRKLYIIIGSDGGDTLYIGAPSSDQRGRIYNKAVQSGLDRYLGCWRYEVVLRNDLARACVQSQRNAPMSRYEYLLAYLCEWYDERGVGTSHLCAVGNVVIPRQRASRTDVERKLKWLEEQVKPSIVYLCELGFRDTLLVLLGLVDA